MNDMEEQFFAQCANPGPQGAFFSLSWAQSLNGAISVSKDQKTVLSGQESMALVHRMRTYHGGLLVGIGTILADNPRLNVRFAQGPSPVQIIVDPRARLPLDARLWDAATHPPLILVGPQASIEGRRALVERGGQVVEVPSQESGGFLWSDIQGILQNLNFSSVMVEGGVSVHNGLMKSGLPLRLLITLCPRFMAGPAMGQDDSRVVREVSTLGTAWYGQDLAWFAKVPGQTT